MTFGRKCGMPKVLLAACPRWRLKRRHAGIGAVSIDEVNLRGDGDDARSWPGRAACDGGAAVGPVVQGALVHVHADEAAGKTDVEVAGKLHGIFEGLLAVVQGVLDAVAQGLGDDLVLVGAQRAADGRCRQGQHQAGGLAPPDARSSTFLRALEE